MLPLHQSPKSRHILILSKNGANSRNNCCMCLVVVGQDGVAPPEFENSRFTVYPATTYGILTHSAKNGTNSSRGIKGRSKPSTQYQSFFTNNKLERSHSPVLTRLELLAFGTPRRIRTFTVASVAQWSIHQPMRARDLFLLALLVEIGNTQGTVQFMTLLWVWCRAFVPSGGPPENRTPILCVQSISSTIRLAAHKQWRRYQESNPDNGVRSTVFYPLNYTDKLAIHPITSRYSFYFLGTKKYLPVIGRITSINLLI